MEPTGLQVDWLKRLLGRLGQIRTERRDELRRLSDLANIDPYVLAGRYVEPRCSVQNPADFNEDDGDIPLTVPWSEWFTKFLGSHFAQKDGRHVVFVLSDSGMGKTSLLAMLKLSSMLEFWPSSTGIRLFKLGHNTLNEIDTISDPHRTVLLLDSLDEDPSAWGRLAERLEALLKATVSFSHVVITCRSQFFPPRGQNERLGKVTFVGFCCNVLYIAPFTGLQIEQYLRKVLCHENRFEAAWNWITRTSNKKLELGRGIVNGPMQSLRIRPMLLAHIEDILEEDLWSPTSYELYRHLVLRWLEREVRKARYNGLTTDYLWRIFEEIACYLHRTGDTEVSQEQLESIARGQDLSEEPAEGLSLTDVIGTFDFGGKSLLNRNSMGEYRFSHYSIQEFMVAHAAIAERMNKDRVRCTDQLLAFLKEGRLKNWANIDLSGLHAVSFRNTDLEGANLTNVDLAGADLRSASLKGANLLNSCLARADLRSANLQDAHLLNSDLSGADLMDANLQGAFCRRARFHSANLTNANLRKAVLAEADFHDAVLENITLPLAQVLSVEFLLAVVRDENKYSEALAHIVKDRNGSASYLQRQLQIGFDRASRLIDLLEITGAVGPPRVSSPRAILATPDDLDKGRFFFRPNNPLNEHTIEPGGSDMLPA